jgi:hypothetical protein
LNKKRHKKYFKKTHGDFFMIRFYWLSVTRIQIKTNLYSVWLLTSCEIKQAINNRS